VANIKGQFEFCIYSTLFPSISNVSSIFITALWKFFEEFVSRPHSSSHHILKAISTCGWKLARKLPSGGVHRQIHFTHRQSWAAISSVCGFLITESAFSRPKPQKSSEKGHGGVVQSFMCVHLSLLQMYIMCGLVPSDVSSSSFLIRRRRESSRRPHIAASNEMAFLGALTREQNMHTRRISAKCTLQNAGPCGLWCSFTVHPSLFTSKHYALCVRCQNEMHFPPL
jgi:hypothetical protein